MLRSVLAAMAVLCLGAGLSPGIAPADAQGGQTEAAPKTTRSAWFKHQPWNSALPEVRKTGSGLEYVVITAGPGNGAMARADQAVRLYYEGRLNSGGRAFDSSFQRGKPDVFGVSELVPGFSEALQLMRPGDRWLVYIPSALAYGNRGVPGMIGPGEDLLFEILLVSAAG
jgi:FKBP-type peptidyl-prolyl cis-trans isomerase